MDIPPLSLRKAPDLSIIVKMPIHGLGYAVRTAYSDTFRLAVADGSARPLLIPFCLLAPFVVPALWLAVPHKRRTWFYHTRWLAMAFIAWSNAYHLMYTSSTNMACAYAAGLASTWGTILSMNLLIWARPQFDAARARRVRKDDGPVELPSSEADDDTGEKKEHTGPQPTGNGILDASGNGLRARKTLPKDAASEVSKQREEYEYIWEPYPAGGGFLERLAWSTDLILSFRCAGWNWSVPSLPRPPIPAQISHGDKIDVDSIPKVSRSGYKRHLTKGEFVRDRLTKVILLYFVLDFLSVYMMKDPYFILGPDHQNYALPPHLRAVPPWLLRAYREVFSLGGVYAAIEAVFGVSDLVQYWMASRFYPSRGALWQYASTFGSFEQVLDRGLAGWWGGWWHQTFRMQFAAPATYLFREGYLKRGSQLASAVAVSISFLQSGMLHASGSLTSVPKTKPWRAPVFFFLQMAGILLQQWMARLLGSLTIPRVISRTANLLFTLVWLYFTAPLFIDDCSSTGLWLVEPVPISPLRFLGFGYEGDHWWRWDWDHLPKLYLGETWWQTGIAL
ncbi:hypothetical protein TARUN_6976 [Trichoderma arundinaceum]|uniref:Wax synthase domain-containing protein n=1 Tax=Trichoderma arundinaceum TaxID=490622 RepID=A0A395NGS1_TRIAR|nr:hypothetical protein TARUN_6976 [Trichoderma arundinaceum]